MKNLSNTHLFGLCCWSLGAMIACGSSDPEDLKSMMAASTGGANHLPGVGGQMGVDATGGASGGSIPGVGGELATGGADLGGTGGQDVAPVNCSGITAAGYELCDSTPTSCGAVFTDDSGCTAVCAAAGLACVKALENQEDACAADTALPELPCDSGHQSDYCECGGLLEGGTGGAPATGGATATGGAPATGGMPATGGTTGNTGDISIFDTVPGWASQAGGTTGGGTNLAGAITVSSMSALQDAVKGSNAAIILIEPGTYSGTLSPGSNKTIIGKGPGVKISGNVSMSGSAVNNLIIRNLAVQGLPCSSYDECRAGADAVYMGNGAHHIWLDHIDISDGQDGNCDVTQGGDYITVSWSKFHYTYNKEHRFSNLIAGSDDEPNSVGKLRVSYMYSWWGDRVNQRSPRGRFGKVHMVNNYHSSQDTSYVAGPGVDAQFLVENCFYEINSGRPAFSGYGDTAAWKGTGNEGNATGMNSSQGSVFTPPYSYTKMAASAVKAAVTSSDCGAGNRCDFE